MQTPVGTFARWASRPQHHESVTKGCRGRACTDTPSWRDRVRALRALERKEPQPACQLLVRHERHRHFGAHHPIAVSRWVRPCAATPRCAKTSALLPDSGRYANPGGSTLTGRCLRMHGGTMSLAVGEANCMKPCVPGRRMCLARHVHRAGCTLMHGSFKGRPQDSLDHAIAIRLGGGWLAFCALRRHALRFRELGHSLLCRINDEASPHDPAPPA